MGNCFVNENAENGILTGPIIAFLVIECSDLRFYASFTQGVDSFAGLNV
jgi:hypothetical protein